MFVKLILEVKGSFLKGLCQEGLFFFIQVMLKLIISALTHTYIFFKFFKLQFISIYAIRS